jgi:WD40 repeat protein
MKGASPTAEAQIWDFRSGNLVHAHGLPLPESRSRYRQLTTYVRYTSDGQLLAMYTGGDLIHVLRANDLDQLRTIQIGSQADITAFEVSPTAHRVAFRMSGDVRVYDLDSGEELRIWRIQELPEFKTLRLLRVNPQLEGRGLAWRGDGRALAISVADNPPCLRAMGRSIFSISHPKKSQTPFGSHFWRLTLGSALAIVSMLQVTPAEGI